MRKYKLTPEHEARFPEWRDRWVKIGLSTERADFDRAETAVRGMYRAAGLDEPLGVLRMGSPYSAILGGYYAHAILSALIPQQVEWQVERQVRQQVRQQVERQVMQQVERQVELDKIEKTFGLSVHDYRGASLWPAWPAYVSFLIEHGLISADTQAVANYLLDQEIAETCGLVWFSSAVAAISDRPECINLDAEGRLHCETGPAIRYPDGWSLYAWHGTVLPERWIMERATIDPTEILREENVELRAAGAACIGWPRMLTALDYKIIDADPDPMHGELIELRLEGLPKPGRFLKAWCPRNGDIVEGVPDNIKTVIEAQAWRVGLTPAEFSYPTVRT